MIKQFIIYRFNYSDVKDVYNGEYYFSEDTNNNSKCVQKSSLRQFFHIFRFSTQFDYLIITLGILFSILSGLLIPFMTYLLGNIFDAFTDIQSGVITNQAFSQKMNSLLLQFLMLGVGSFFFISSMIICWKWTGERQSTNMKIIYFRALLKIGIDNFERNELTIGGLSTSVNKDADNIRSLISDNMGYLIQEVFIIFSTLILAFNKHAILALVTLVTTPLLFIVLYFTESKAGKLIIRERNIFIQAGNVLENALSAIKTVRAFNNEEKEEEKHYKYLQNANHVSSNLAWTYGLRFGIIQFFFLSLFVQGFYYGSTLVANKKLRPGGVLSVFYSIMLGLSVLKNILPRIVSIIRAKNSTFAMNRLLEQSTLKDLEALRNIKLPKIVGNIEFNQVSFSYPSRPDTWVLSNINLTIPANKTTVFMGENGSGKSSIIQLIQKFYETEDGFITIDGHDLKTLNTSWLRQQIGVVNQEPLLFDDTIFANVAYGRADYWNTTLKEVEDVCKLVFIHDFIMELPEGYNTILGNKSNKLSGGQRQKIAIARALIKNPAILILDEASSALDITSDHMIQKALENCRKCKTTIVITHQLQHIGESDLVYVLHEGVIVESGTKSKLLNIKNGHYNKLALEHYPHSKRLTYELDSINKRLNTQVTLQINMPTTSSITAKRLSSNKYISIDIPNTPPSRTKSFRNSWNFDEFSYIDMLQGTASAAVSKRNDNSVSISEIISYYKNDEDGVTIDVISMKSKEKEESKSKFPILKLINDTMENKLLYTFGIIASIINGFVMPLFSFVLASLLNTYSITDKKELVSKSSQFALLVLLIAGINGLSSHFKYFLLEKASERWAVRLRQIGFGKVLRQPQSWFDKSENATGKLTTILTTDTETSKSLIGHYAANIIFGLVSLLGGIIWAFAIGWQLTLVGFSLVTVILLTSELQVYVLQKYEKKQKLATENATNCFYQTISSLRTVFSLAIESAMESKFRLALEYPFKIGIKKAFICGFATGFLDSLSYFTKALTFWYGARLVSQGIYDLEKMLIVWTLVIFCTTSASQMLGTIPYYAKSKQAIKTINNIINLPIIPDTEGIIPDNVLGTIKFENVKFSYPERPEITVLDGFNLNISQGQTVALVGKSGNGKSTVAALLQRIYEPISGSIKLDEVDLKNFQLRWLRENIGIVSQEPDLFDMTIAENIAYGKDNATQEEIENVAKQVNLHEFIRNLPNSYDTRLGSCGSQLSGGQRQRIAIARVLLKNTRILILDEAKSSLDSINNDIVQETLNQFQKGRTTLVITHNIESVINFDKIALVENGKIVESGTHKELIAKSDKYFNLLKSYKS